jgi:diguanylate cyclase (GGDEF)-like protein
MQEPKVRLGEGIGGRANGLALRSHPFLWDIAHLLVSEESPDAVLQAVADALAELVPYDTLTLFEVDAARGSLRPVLCRDSYAEEIMAMDPIPFGQGITGAVAASGQPRLVNDAHLDPSAVQIPGTPDEPESMVVVPLVARDEATGCLSLYRLGEANHFSEEELGLAVRFAGLAALAIDNARTRASLQAQVLNDPLTGLRNHGYFHERLREEVKRATRHRGRVGLVLMDVDDFKKVNDCYGHGTGDQVLRGLAALMNETCRTEDVLCRIGGDEFAVILPGTDAEGSTVLAERIRNAVAGTGFPVAGRVTVSLGVAVGPVHASSGRDLFACADMALLQAKGAGKDRVQLYERGAATGTGAGRPRSRGELRSVAHLKMLQSVAAKLNRLHDVDEIGEAILAELKGLIDYHNCRIHVMSEDGTMLVPVAFRGELLEYRGETFDALLTRVGEGITGRAAETGESLYVPNAAEDEQAVQIPGTPEVDESILAVPVRYGERITGTIVLSKLGIDQFDQDDVRLLEVLASNAAVALENARLLQVERESARVARSLLELSASLANPRDTAAVLQEAVARVPDLLGVAEVGAWLRDPLTGYYIPVAERGIPDELKERWAELVIPDRVGDQLVMSTEDPLVVPPAMVSDIPPEYQLHPGSSRPVLVAPMRWEPDGFASLVMFGEEGRAFTSRQIRLARGITDICSLALGNANSYQELERSYVGTIEALANALEAQDESTHNHARDLAEMSLAVGAEFGIEGEDLKTLELAALMHDIGKIGVSGEIIRKPGPLTPAERREINRHPEIGEQIVAPVPFLQHLRPIIRACHERWDGNGYPDGLTGEDIPLEARIVFVCDAFHAMTTDRPYRDALPEREAIRRLKLAAGTQFDRRIVDAFVRLHGEGRLPHAHHAADHPAATAS